MCRKRVTRAWNLYRKVVGELGASFSTAQCRLGASLSGVELGAASKFYGRATFQRAKLASISIGERCLFRSSHRSNLIGINRPCIISAHGKAKLVIGNECGFSGTAVASFREIVIGNRVRCGANTLITDGDWHDQDDRVGAARPVYIEDDVWLGVGAMVLKGVRIGRASVIGAGSVVTRDIPAGVVAAGNPCRVIGPLN